MKIFFNNIREFFWPLIEGEEEIISVSPVEEMEILVSDENLEETFNLTFKIFESEEERRKSIESKAALFINTISVASSIVIAANTLITGNKTYNLAIIISVLVSFILSIYAVRTVWLSVKALERGNYHILGFKEINISGTRIEYYRRLIFSLKKLTEANQAAINKKVDFLALAQEYYKRAIIIICIYSFFVFLFCMLSIKQKADFSSSKINISFPVKANNYNAIKKPKDSSYFPLRNTPVKRLIQ